MIRRENEDKEHYSGRRAALILILVWIAKAILLL